MIKAFTSKVSHTSPVSRSQIMTQYDLGGGAEEPKIVWHHKLTETLQNLWLAPEKSSLIQGITLTLLLGGGGGGHSGPKSRSTKPELFKSLKIYKSMSKLNTKISI